MCMHQIAQCVCKNRQLAAFMRFTMFRYFCSGGLAGVRMRADRGGSPGVLACVFESASLAQDEDMTSVCCMLLVRCRIAICEVFPHWVGYLEGASNGGVDGGDAQ